jgi:lactate dehydrogenase-like 2-hydroxyacid dehydrogenase
MKHLKKILITRKISDYLLDPLKEIGEVDMWQEPYDLMPRPELMKRGAGVAAIINFAELMVDVELLDRFPDLEVVSNVSIGTDNFDLRCMTARKVWGANAPGYYSPPVAEYVMGSLVMLMRGLPDADRFVRSGNWNSFQPGRWDKPTLSGKNMGLVGYGTIGQLVGGLAVHFGMHIRFYDPWRKGLPGYTDLDELLGLSDVVSIHMPLTRENEYLFDKERLGKMKTGAILVNTSRGKLVRESDLLDALKAKHISGAILDVFENEPEVGKELRNMDQVILTPHIAGGTIESRNGAIRHAVENVVRVMQGREPLNAVNQLSDENN